MERIEYRTVDKSEWRRGPWDSEPDKVQWQDEATGFPCLIVRNHVGALCGYVGVAKDHPSHGKHYDDVDVVVHGGLTFAAACSSGSEAESICHKPSAGEPDDVWWLGFDCAHYSDLCPSPILWRSTASGTYRDIEYVTNEVRSLAKQLSVTK